MSMYTVTTPQLLCATILSAVISACSVICYQQYRERLGIPEVYMAIADNTCVKVINFRNGDAYNCEDVDVVLRHYRIVSGVKK